MDTTESMSKDSKHAREENRYTERKGRREVRGGLFGGWTSKKQK